MKVIIPSTALIPDRQGLGGFGGDTSRLLEFPDRLSSNFNIENLGMVY